MKSTAVKIMKNSLYGTFGKSLPSEEPELYCEHCYSKIKQYMWDAPLGCFECEDGIKSDARFLTKKELRELKIDKLLNYEPEI